MEIKTKYGLIKIFTENIEQEAINQIIEFGNSPLGENAHIRIMPDVHSGAGCVIGTTMKITDKICPNIVGVDISCGVTLVKTDADFKKNLQKLDKVIHENIPYGRSVHDRKSFFEPLEKMISWSRLDKETKNKAVYALGSLGGGNHFIEAYENGYLCVHSGSRNIGYKVAEYYQKLAYQTLKNQESEIRIKEILPTIPPKKREEFIKKAMQQIHNIDKDLAYLTDQNFSDYLHDIKILDDFATANRKHMLESICEKMNCTILESINTTHNYIDVETMILRKGAVCADKDKMLLIPMNMRDGLLVCKGKGNNDWNNSAPHGAGRLYSRHKAKEKFTIEQFQESMKGIYSTCIKEGTLDEMPFVYKNYEEIIKYIEPTVEIIDRLIPIYNFKAID